MHDKEIDDLLAQWHQWCRNQSVTATGYPSVAAGFGMYRASRQYDDANGALDEAADNWLMQIVDTCIEKMETRHRMVLSFVAKNCATGRDVWWSARLPQEPTAKAALVLEARWALVRQLDRAGWVWGKMDENCLTAH